MMSSGVWSLSFQFSAPPPSGHPSDPAVKDGCWSFEPSGAYARPQGGGQGKDSHIILSGDSVAIHTILPCRSHLGQLGFMPILEEGGEDGCRGGNKQALPFQCSEEPVSNQGHFGNPTLFLPQMALA